LPGWQGRREGDETIGNLHRIQLGEAEGMWQWALTVSLPGPHYTSPTSGVEPSRGAAPRRVIENHRHYFSTRPTGSESGLKALENGKTAS